MMQNKLRAFFFDPDPVRIQVPHELAFLVDDTCKKEF